VPTRVLGVYIEPTAHPGRSARNHLRSLVALPACRAGASMTSIVGLDAAADRRGDVLDRDAPAAGSRPLLAPAIRSTSRSTASTRRHPMAAHLPTRARRGQRTVLLRVTLTEAAQTVDDVVVSNIARTPGAIGRGAVVVRPIPERLVAAARHAGGRELRTDGC
jgi:hypothetical protein